MKLPLPGESLSGIFGEWGGREGPKSDFKVSYSFSLLLRCPSVRNQIQRVILESDSFYALRTSGPK